MMRELESLLKSREKTINFDEKNNRVRCFAHIINICSSHLVNAMSNSNCAKVSETNDEIYESESEFDSDSESDIVRDDESDTEEEEEEDDDDDDDKRKLALGKVHPWSTALKRNPLKRARKLIRFLRASDQRRGLLRTTIIDGNEHRWFFLKSKKGIREQVDLPVVQLLKDVKTRWDSVYLMLERLITLRPVSYLFHFHSWWTTLIAILYRLLIGSSEHISPSSQKSLSSRRWTGRSWKVWSRF